MILFSFGCSHVPRRLLLSVPAAALFLTGAASASPGSNRPPLASVAAKAHGRHAPRHPKRGHPDSALWATVDVCHPPDAPYVVGIRGSMPGDGHGRHQMFMRFRIQFRNSQQRWVSVAGGADSGFLAVGSGNARERQSGRNFHFRPGAYQPPPYRPHYELRGSVEFQWRSGRRVVRDRAEVTSAGRVSRQGSDPPGYSAATCTLN